MTTRQAIVIDSVQEPTGVNLTMTIVCWLVAQATRVIPNSNFVSRVPVAASSGLSWGETASDITLLQSGSIVEQVTTISFIVSGLTNAIVEAAIQARYAYLQNALTNLVYVSPSGTHFIGGYWDGTNWVAGP